MVLAATSTPSAPGWQTWTLGSLSNLLSANGRLILCLHDEATSPSGVNYLTYVMGDSASNKPKLDITYTPPATGLWLPSHYDGGLNDRMHGGI